MGGRHKTSMNNAENQEVNSNDYQLWPKHLMSSALQGSLSAQDA